VPLQDLFRQALKRTDLTGEQRTVITNAVQICRFFSGSLANWRWETLFIITTSMLKFMPGMMLLKDLYEDLKDEFNIKEGGVFEAFMYCSSSPLFWRQTSLLCKLATWPSILGLPKVRIE
jgi:hypothetical protein